MSEDTTIWMCPVCNKTHMGYERVCTHKSVIDYLLPFRDIPMPYIRPSPPLWSWTQPKKR